MAGNPLPFKACVLIPNSCNNQTPALLQRTLSRDRRKRHTLLTVLQTFICVLLVPTSEGGVSATKKSSRLKGGKQVLVVWKLTSPGFPVAVLTRSQHKERKKKLEELPHPRQATFFTTELQTFPAQTARPPGQQTSNFGPTGDEWVHRTTVTSTPRSTAPRFPRFLHSLFSLLRKAHRSVLSAPLARPGFETHFNLSTQKAFIAFRVPLRPGFKSYGFFFSLAFLTKEGYFVNYQLVQINKRYFHRKPHFILLKFDYKDGEKGRKSKRKPQMAFPFIAVNELYLCLLKLQPWKSISVGLKNLTKIIGLPFLMQQPLGTGWKDFFMGSPAWIKIMEIRYFIINYSGR